MDEIRTRLKRFDGERDVPDDADQRIRAAMMRAVREEQARPTLFVDRPDVGDENEATTLVPLIPVEPAVDRVGSEPHSVVANRRWGVLTTAAVFLLLVLAASVWIASPDQEETSVATDVDATAQIAAICAARLDPAADLLDVVRVAPTAPRMRAYVTEVRGALEELSTETIDPLFKAELDELIGELDDLDDPPTQTRVLAGAEQLAAVVSGHVPALVCDWPRFEAGRTVDNSFYDGFGGSDE